MSEGKSKNYRRLIEKNAKAQYRKDIFTHMDNLCKQPLKVRIHFMWKVLRGINPPYREEGKLMSEKTFQNYFMSIVSHGYRTSLTSGSGFPDLIMVHNDDTVSFVELKLLLVGASGDKKLKSLFKDSQPPWFMRFITKGGRRLFVAFKLNKGYGLLQVTKEFIMNVDALKYSDLLKMDTYEEFDKLKVLVQALEEK